MSLWDRERHARGATPHRRIVMPVCAAGTVLCVRRTGVRLGLCGFAIGASEYFRRFRVVEVQQTFYAPPQDQTLSRWRRQAPTGIEFTLKAWQLVTHDASSPTYRRLRRPLGVADCELVGSFRLTPPVLQACERTLECARLLRATAILPQWPRSFRATDGNVARLTTFCREIERPEGVRLVWEPRGPWPSDVSAPSAARATWCTPSVRSSPRPSRRSARTSGGMA